MTPTDNDDACADGGAGDASTVMRAPPLSLRSRLALRLECWAPWAHLVALTWWPVVRALRGAAARSTWWAGVQAFLQRAMPWAFRVALQPSFSGAGIIPVARDRLLFLPMAFGGSCGFTDRCSATSAPTIAKAHGERRFRWTNAAGTMGGWRRTAAR